jgi:hypothetical protein
VYKRTPVAAIERGSGTPPLDIYVNTLARQRAIKTADYLVTKEIQERLKKIYQSIKAQRQGRRRRRRPPKLVSASQSPIEVYRLGSWVIRDKQRQEQPRANNIGRQVQAQSAAREIGQLFTKKWEQRWRAAGSKPYREAPTWKDDREFQPLQLYDDKPKHLATAIMLLRTEIIGLRAWLAKIGVSNIDPTCTCGHSRQTLTHVMAFCPDTKDARLQLLTRGEQST